jgi:hypothetical protein
MKESVTVHRKIAVREERMVPPLPATNNLQASTAQRGSWQMNWLGIVDGSIDDWQRMSKPGTTERTLIL